MKYLCVYLCSGKNVFVINLSGIMRKYYAIVNSIVSHDILHCQYYIVISNSILQSFFKISFPCFFSARVSVSAI